MKLVKLFIILALISVVLLRRHRAKDADKDQDEQCKKTQGKDMMWKEVNCDKQRFKCMWDMQNKICRGINQWRKEPQKVKTAADYEREELEARAKKGIGREGTPYQGGSTSISFGKNSEKTASDYERDFIREREAKGIGREGSQYQGGSTSISFGKNSEKTASDYEQDFIREREEKGIGRNGNGGSTATGIGFGSDGMSVNHYSNKETYNTSYEIPEGKKYEYINHGVKVTTYGPNGEYKEEITYPNEGRNDRYEYGKPVNTAGLGDYRRKHKKRKHIKKY